MYNFGIDRNQAKGVLVLKEKVFVREEAADIVELFEDVLSEHDITVPSDEDDEREPDNAACLYGMVYWELVDDVEGFLIERIETGDAAGGAVTLIEMFKAVLDRAGLAVPEVSFNGEPYRAFLREVESALADVIERGRKGEVIPDLLGE